MADWSIPSRAGPKLNRASPQPSLHCTRNLVCIPIIIGISGDSDTNLDLTYYLAPENPVQNGYAIYSSLPRQRPSQATIISLRSYAFLLQSHHLTHIISPWLRAGFSSLAQVASALCAPTPWNRVAWPLSLLSCDQTTMPP